MRPSNREIQQQKTCHLYAYLLTALGKEVPLEIEECVDDYGDPVDCVPMLYKALQALESDTFEKVVNDQESQEARDLAQWWEMYQLYIPIK